MFIRFVVVVMMLGLTACASLPDNSGRLFSQAVNGPNNQALSQNLPSAESAIDSASRFALLNSGIDAFTARALMAKQAQFSIDAQYYVLHDDLVGNLFLGLLADAASRGVRVRLLLDDYYVEDKDTRLIAMDSFENVEVRIFNPFARGGGRTTQFLGRFNEVSRRMHNKSFIVDNQAMIVGGRNIGDEYFSASSEYDFLDLDVMGAGPIVSEQSASFDRYWNSELSYSVSTLNKRAPSPEKLAAARQDISNYLERNDQSVYSNALRQSAFADALRNGGLDVIEGQARVIADLPEKIISRRGQQDVRIVSEIGSEFESAREEITIITPYFVPGRWAIGRFRLLTEAGIRVRVLTNSIATNNQPLVHAHYGRYRRALIEAGVELYELAARDVEGADVSEGGIGGVVEIPTLHAKAFIVDRKTTFIGSLNFDPRSVVENTEQGVLYQSEKLANGISVWLDEELPEIAWQVLLDDENKLVWMKADGERTERLTIEPYSTLGRRLRNRLVRLLPIEPLL